MKPHIAAAMISATLMAGMSLNISDQRYGSSGPSLKGDELRAARDRKKRERKNRKKNR